MISQFFVLSLRGDIIITRDYRYDVPRTSSETFFRKVKFWGTEGESAPPVFHADGVNYFHVKVIFWILNLTHTHSLVGFELSCRIRTDVSGVQNDFER